MSVTRRSAIKGLGIGTTAAAIMSFDGPRSIARALSMALPVQERPLLLHNNENPLGPGDVVTRAMGEAMSSGLGSRYGLPGRQTVQAIADTQGIPADHLMLGNGSTQILRSLTHVYTSPTRHLVTASPSFETMPEYAAIVGHPVEAVPLDADLKIDLDAMADAAKGAGIVFFCNPNNPTATLHRADAVGAFIDRVLTETDAMILVDEAYFDYVTDPGNATQIPMALANDRVLVSRTFSKAHGMAGMRMGWLVGKPDVIRKVRAWHYGGTLNAPALLGAKASIEDPGRIEREAARNTAVREFTLDWFASRGFEATDAQTNFLFVNTGMPASKFREACAEHNVLVGRDFPPYQDEWMRISLGTMDEMERAVDVFGRILVDSAGRRQPGAEAAA
jgi:histidinol-phosphate aminotransferase